MVVIFERRGNYLSFSTTPLLLVTVAIGGLWFLAGIHIAAPPSPSNWGAMLWSPTRTSHFVLLSLASLGLFILGLPFVQLYWLLFRVKDESEGIQSVFCSVAMIPTILVIGCIQGLAVAGIVRLVIALVRLI